MVWALSAADLAGAQDADAAAESGQRLIALEERRDTIGDLALALEDLRIWDRDGLSTRIDLLTLRLLEDVNAYASDRLESTGTGLQDEDRLAALLDWSTGFGLARIAALEIRASEERGQFAKFQVGPQAEIARAFVHDLRLLRLDYLSVLIDQIDIRRAGGAEVAPLAAAVAQGVRVALEQLSGQIRLDALSLEGLRSELRESPGDQDLVVAVALVDGKQSRNLEALELLLPLGRRLGIDVSEQRGLLIQERGRLGIEILERDVFSVVWAEQFEQLLDVLSRRGPSVLFQLTLFLLIVTAGWLVARLIRPPVRLLLSRERLGLSRLLQEVLASVAGIVVFGIGIVVALAALGVSLGPMLAGIGVIGIIVGFAVQDSLGNLAAGAMILFYRPYDVDDHVRVGGAEGVVKRMNLIATTIATFDNQILVLPNRNIWGDTIVNYTASRVRRLGIKVCFSYREDPDRVRAVLLDLVSNHEQVLSTPEPLIHMDTMEDSALTMMVKPWVRTEDYWSTQWDLLRLIKQRLDAEGIAIPYPQLDVHHHYPEAAEGRSPETA